MRDWVRKMRLTTGKSVRGRSTQRVRIMDLRKPLAVMEQVNLDFNGEIENEIASMLAASPEMYRAMLRAREYVARAAERGEEDAAETLKEFDAALDKADVSSRDEFKWRAEEPTHGLEKK